MNKEIINTTKRVYNNNSEDILLLENKIEIINNKLEKLNKDLHEQEGIIFISKGMSISLSILILLISLSKFIYGGLTSPNNFLTYAIPNSINELIYSSIIFGTGIIYYNIVKTIFKKKIIKTNNEITNSKKIKETYEKELSDIKEKQLTPLSPTISLNKPISLKEKTNIIEKKINDEVKTYNEDLNKQPKKLILQKKN